jgi:hypothetical protein
MAVRQYGLVNVLEEVRKKYAGNSAGLFQALRSVEAFRGVLGVTAENLAEVQKGQDSVRESSGMMAGAYKENSNTLENALHSLNGSAAGLVETMENSLGIISLFTEALRGAASAIQMLSGTGLPEGTKSALAMGGIAGLDQLEARSAHLRNLTKDIAEYQKAYAQGLSPNMSSDWVEFGGDMPDEMLKRIGRELDVINGKISEATPEMRRQLDTTRSLRQLEETRGAGLISEVEYLVRKNNLLVSADEIEKSIVQEVETQARLTKEKEEAQSKFLKDQEQALKLQEEEKKKVKDLLKDAEGLAQTEAERLTLKRDTYKWMLAEGTVSEEVGRKVIANLDQQIALLKEREAVSSRGGWGGGGGSIEKSITENWEEEQRKRIDLLKEQPERMREAFELEEKLLEESYERRKDIILPATELTEEAKQKLLDQAAKRYSYAEGERLAEYWQMQEQTLGSALGNLAEVSQAFGKKGFAAYKAFAMAQAAIAAQQAILQAYLGGLTWGGGNHAVGAVFASIAAAATGVQIAAIAKQEYSGEYATGGLIPPGSVGLVGEAGPELVRGPAMVTSAQATWDRRGANQAPQSNNVEIHIVNNTGESVQQSRRMEGNREMIEFVIGQAKEGVANDITKGGTRIARAIESTYNMGRGRR